MPGHLPDRDEDSDLLQQTRKKIERPKLYKVLLHNDDYTTQEFVVWVLMQIFRKTEEEATTIMLAVHRSGLGVAGVYPHEIAETKVERTLATAKENGFPLLCTMEPE